MFVQGLKYVGKNVSVSRDEVSVTLVLFLSLTDHLLDSVRFDQFLNCR